MSDSDELGQFPSAASPLSALGLDPDEVRANPDLLARLTNRSAYQPAPSSSPRQTPQPNATPAEPTDEEGYGRAGLSSLYRGSQAAEKATSQVPTETPEDVKRLQAQEETLQPKTPLRDATGNMLPEYKPTAGQKFLRGLRSGAVGFLTGGIPGAAVGAIEPQDIRGGTAYGAPNKTYDRAEQKRTDQLGATQTNLDQARKNWEEAVKARQTQASDFRANAALGKDLTTGATGLINAENKPETEANKTNAKLELTDKEFTQRSGQADRLGLRGTQRALYIANGKLPDPRQPTEGEAALVAATQAFTRQNGRPPQTLEEMNQVASASKGTLDKGTKGKPSQEKAIQFRRDADWQKARIAFDRATKDAVPTSASDQKAIEAAKDEFYDRRQEVQNEYEQAILAAGGDVEHVELPRNVLPGDGQPSAPAQPTAPAPSVAATPTAPTPAPAAAPATQPKPAPDGTKIKLQDGTTQVKRNGKWVNE